ncbi:hypothetical protein CCACVL1_02677 [Corchorus capsularis]|uniref:Uncharacterized protein n=1 Tax=Corchorus capsularis TaxID=210143 RepID=A0A1R3K722_COCAP|nr:hypothetical protein CCACVL1_02677 [Corchorus capsularis]
MGPNLNKTEVTTKVVSTNKGKGILIDDQEDERMPRKLDKEVDFAHCMNYGEYEMIDVQSQDTTEYSSSFGDTMSGDENGLVASDDPEVESQLSDPKLFGSMFDGRDGRLLGKKKLTDHWRKFISPIMWRCKLLEVKLQELKSQELKYERELAEYDQRKQCESDKVTLEGFDATSLAFPSKIQRKEVMERKKRKRVEDTTDLASHMSKHAVLSYFESRKSVVSASALIDDWGDLEAILLKIEVLTSRIIKLKARMDKVVSESHQKLPSIDVLNSPAPCGVLDNSEHRLYPETRDRNGSQCTASQHASEFDISNDLVPGCAVLDHEEEDHVPDLIRSMSRRLLEMSSENAAKEELRDFGSAIIQRVEKPLVSIENLKAASLVQAPGNNLPLNTSLQPNAQPPFSQSKQPNKKRTRGVQKSGLGRWSRRSSG